MERGASSPLERPEASSCGQRTLPICPGRSGGHRGGRRLGRHQAGRCRQTRRAAFEPSCRAAQDEVGAVGARELEGRRGRGEALVGAERRADHVERAAPQHGRHLGGKQRGVPGCEQRSVPDWPPERRVRPALFEPPGGPGCGSAAGRALQASPRAGLPGERRCSPFTRAAASSPTSGGSAPLGTCATVAAAPVSHVNGAALTCAAVRFSSDTLSAAVVITTGGASAGWDESSARPTWRTEQGHRGVSVLGPCGKARRARQSAGFGRARR